MIILKMLDWINHLKLDGDLFDMVDKHYLKYLLFIKLTSGCNVTEKDLKECNCTFDNSSLRIEMKFKKKVDIPKLSSLMEYNVHDFECDINTRGNIVIVTIKSDKEEVYTVANLLTSNA